MAHGTGTVWAPSRWSLPISPRVSERHWSAPIWRNCATSRPQFAWCSATLPRTQMSIEPLKAMQFHLVASSNEGAVWLRSKLGFATVGRLPKAFRHPLQKGG